jgi:hypothetical protein
MVHTRAALVSLAKAEDTPNHMGRISHCKTDLGLHLSDETAESPPQA